MRSWPLTMLQLESLTRCQNRGNSIARIALAPDAGAQAGRV